MLPGYIAGHYSFDEVHIDLRRLAEFAGARFFRDEAIGIDRAARTGALPPPAAGGLRLAVDQYRLDARGWTAWQGAAEHAVPVKPIRDFNERWLALLERVRRHAGTTTIAVVGARRRRRRADAGDAVPAAQRTARRWAAIRTSCASTCFTAGARILPTHNAAVRRAFERVLAARGVVLHRDAEVRRGRRRHACRRGGRRAGRRRNRLGDAGRRRALAARHRAGAGRRGLHPGQRHAAKRDRPADFRRRRHRRDDRAIRWRRPACSPCAWARRWRDNLRRASRASRCAPTARSGAGWR